MQRLILSGRHRALTVVQTLQRSNRVPAPLQPPIGAARTQFPLACRHNTAVAAAAQPEVQTIAAQQPQSLANGSPAMGLLAAMGDVYDGINIDANQLPTDAAEFADSLQYSLQEWRQTERKGVWLRVPIQQAHLVPVATQQGFYFHHAERDYVMLAQWLPETEDKLPANASHQVGVGAFVFDRQSQRVLMVQERNGPLRGKGVWKMPTGLATQREDIGDAAEREVLEETGVRAKFHSVLAIRQAHTALFGKSDIFAVVALEPEAGAVDSIAIQEDELVAAEWQSLAEFEENPFPKTIPLLAKIVDRCLAYARSDYPGLAAEKFAVPSRQREDILIYGSDGPAKASL